MIYNAFSVKDIEEALNDIADAEARKQAMRAFNRVFPMVYWTLDADGFVIVDE